MKHREFIAAVVAAVFLTGVAVAVTAHPQVTQEQPPAGAIRPFDSLALAQGRGGRGGPGPGGFGLPGLRQLDLSDAQKEQIKQIHESHRAEFEQLANQMRQLQEKVQGETEGVLTAEQQAKLKELREQRGPRGPRLFRRQ